MTREREFCYIAEVPPQNVTGGTAYLLGLSYHQGHALPEWCGKPDEALRITAAGRHQIQNALAYTIGLGFRKVLAS